MPATPELPISRGGVKVGGSPAIRVLREYPVYRLTGSGGVTVGGGSRIVKSKNLISVVASGGIKVGRTPFPDVDVSTEASLPWHAVQIKSSGGVSVQGAPEVSVVRPTTVSVDSTVAMSVGGNAVLAVIKPISFTQIAADPQENVIDDTYFDTWVLNDNLNQPLIYTGYNFNSYAVFENQGYGAGPDGVFLLEGDDDAGLLIRAE